jgi:hypothetical protein
LLPPMKVVICCAAKSITYGTRSLLQTVSDRFRDGILAL